MGRRGRKIPGGKRRAQRATPESDSGPVPQGCTRGSLALVLLAILVPAIAALRLAQSPVFVYWPGGSGPGRPLALDPRAGPRIAFGGPFYQLQPGTYEASFRLRLAPAPPGTPAVRLELLAEQADGTKPFSREVAAGTGGAGQHDERLRFTVTLPALVQTRLFYHAASPVWLDGIRVWPAWPAAPRAPFWVFASIAAGALLAAFIRGWRVPLDGGLLRAAPKVYFAALAGLTVAAAARAGSLSPLNVQWILPPPLLVPALLLGGGAVLALIRRFSPDAADRVLIADWVSDGLTVVLLAVLLPRLDPFSLGAVALGAWATKVVLACVALASAQQKRALAGAVAIAAYAYLGLLLWYHQYPVSGDQASYLAETVSLVRRHSVNTWDSLAAGDFKEFAPYTSKEALQGDTVAAGGVPGFPARDLGPSLLAIPGYLAGKLNGVRLEWALVAILSAAMLFALIRRLGVRPGAAVLAWAATCFCLPVLNFSSVVYTEIAAAALVVVGVWALRTDGGRREMLWLGIVIALLPRFSVRYGAIALAFLLLGLWRARRLRSGKTLAALLAPPLLVTAAAVWVNASTYGLAVPNAGHWLLVAGANPSLYGPGIPVSWRQPGWAGLWLDKHWGLFSSAPIFLLALAGIPALWRRSRTVVIYCAVVAVPYFAVIASIDFWQGGPSPPPRYLVPILPLLALPLAAFLDRLRPRAAWIFAAPALVAGGVTALAALSSVDADYVGARLAARCLGSFGFSMSALLPRIQDGGFGVRTLLLILAWSAAACALAYLAGRPWFGRPEPPPESDSAGTAPSLTSLLLDWKPGAPAPEIHERRVQPPRRPLALRLAADPRLWCWIALGVALVSLYLWMPGPDPAEVISSDTLYPVNVFTDLLVDRFPLAGWKFSIAPCWFPDLFLVGVAFLLTRHVVVATLLAGFAQHVLLVLGMLWCWRVLRLRNRRLLDVLTIGAATAIALVVPLRPDLGYQFYSRFFLPQTHVGNLVMMVFAFDLAAWLATVPASRRRRAAGLAAYVAVCFLGAMSNLLFLIHCLAACTVALGLLCAVRAVSARQAAVPVAIGWVAGVAGVVANATVFDVTSTFSQSVFGLEALRTALAVFGAGAWRLLARGDFLHLSALAWLVACAVLGLRCLRRARPAHPGREPAAWALFFLFALSSSLLSVIAVIGGGSNGLTVFKDYVWTMHYLYPAFLLPLLAWPAVIGVVELPDRLLRMRPAAVAAALCGVVTVAAMARTPYSAVPVHRYVPPLVRFLDEHAREYNLRYGLAGYWQARLITLLSRTGLRVYQIDGSLNPLYWVNNTAWYRQSLEDRSAPPRFNFVVLNDPKWKIGRAAAVQRMGEPTRELSIGQTPILIYEHAKAASW